MTAPTKAQWKQFDRKIDNLSELHFCEDKPNGRVETPGFDIQALIDGTFEGPYFTTWTCDICRPLYIAIVDEFWGGHQLVMK